MINAMNNLAAHVWADNVPELATASWSNALLLGRELVTSGMTGHPVTRNAAEAGEPLDAYQQTLLVLGKILALAEAAGGHIGNLLGKRSIRPQRWLRFPGWCFLSYVWKSKPVFTWMQTLDP